MERGCREGQAGQEGKDCPRFINEGIYETGSCKICSARGACDCKNIPGGIAMTDQELNASNIHKNLKDIMTFLEMSQLDLSKMTGLTQACISQILSGQREPSIKTVIKLLKALNISFERLCK